MNKTNWKIVLAKIVSVGLIAFGLYQIALSLQTIFFIYPSLFPGSGRASLAIQTGLVEKALILYATMTINSLYGITLLLKPSQEVKIGHLVLGIGIFIVSVFFLTKTAFTTDPLLDFLLELIIGKT